MKVAVIPDSAMIVIPLIEKNGHEYISSHGFSKYNNYSDDGMDKSKPPYNLKGFKNILLDLPSGVKGRLSLFYPTYQKAEAFILIEDDKSRNAKLMYDGLNELILFGSNGCTNERAIVLDMIKQKDVPVLKLSHPNNRDEIIDLIEVTNSFLKNLTKFKGKNVLFDKTRDDSVKLSYSEFCKNIDLNNGS